MKTLPSILLLAFLVGCGTTQPPPDSDFDPPKPPDLSANPTIRISAVPEVLPAGGGTVVLSWIAPSNAPVSIQPGDFTTVGSGMTPQTITRSTTWTMTVWVGDDKLQTATRVYVEVE